MPFGINHLLDSPKSESDVNEFDAKLDDKLEELSFLKDFSMLDSFMNDPDDVLINGMEGPPHGWSVPPHGTS